eukprot:CAMPEP_0194266650 /NCGR_PEP_ID=MMETSP0169-20130528/1491_1 /TAXON_ID=218684 /ORGANISM="Corethron pennatum, Strain L29A3" /LENGTH=214 /DNA_ID=CAMNT_0039007389 /DNA_START=160 /DNA_END=805 /DNA_ORIENTATION=+
MAAGGRYILPHTARLTETTARTRITGVTATAAGARRPPPEAAAVPRHRDRQRPDPILRSGSRAPKKKTATDAVSVTDAVSGPTAPVDAAAAPTPAYAARNEEARLSSSFVHLSCGIYGGAHEQQVSTEEAPPSDDGSSCSFGFDMDEDQEEQPTSQKSYGNFLFDEDQEMEDEVRTHDGAPAPTQVAATPSGSKDGGCLSRSPSSIMFFDNFSY